MRASWGLVISPGRSNRRDGLGRPSGRGRHGRRGTVSLLGIYAGLVPKVLSFGPKPQAASLGGFEHAFRIASDSLSR